jgi:hypothetical protein
VLSASRQNPTLAEDGWLVAHGLGYERCEPAITLQGLWSSCQDNILGVLSDPAGTTPSASEQGASAATRTGSRRAEQGFPLASVLHSYRLGSVVIWDPSMDTWCSLPSGPTTCTGCGTGCRRRDPISMEVAGEPGQRFVPHRKRYAHRGDGRLGAPRALPGRRQPPV